MGEKQDEKFRSHFEPHGDTDLLRSLRQHGFEADQITDVLLTHFHFDHVGGAVSKDKDGKLFPTFPNARYWTSSDHYKWALDPNFREKASFLKENFVPLYDMGVLNFLPTKQDIDWIEGISLKFMYGHTEAMIVPIIPVNDKKMAYMADLLPSSGHVRMPYVMSYDIRPLQTLKEKALFFEEALANDYYLFLEHDPVHEICKINKNEKGRFGLEGTYTLKDIG